MDEEKAALRAYRLAMARTVAQDASAVFGVGLLGFGCWMAWPPLGFIVSGGALLGLAVVGAWRGRGA